MDDQRPGRENEPEPQPDDLHIEVGNLDQPTLRPSDERTHLAPGKQGAAPWYRQSVTVPRPVVAAAVVALLVLVLLVVAPLGSALGMLQSQPTPAPTTVRFVFPTPVPATPTPSPYPTPTLISVPAIGLIPRDCPPSTRLVAFDPTAVGGGVGGPQVWLVPGHFFFGSRGVPVELNLTAQLGALRPSDYTPFGWPVQIMLLVNPGLDQPITLSGSDLRTGYPLWLTSDPNEPAVPTFTIDPGQLESSTSDGQWRIWFGILYLPGAGCYTLQASWLAGGWTVHLASGR